jgi:selenium metabolism protein YedF
MKTLDCRKMLCPRPVLETRKQLLAAPDETITVLVDNAIAQANVTRLAAKEGFSAVATVTSDAISLLISPEDKTAASDNSSSAKTDIPHINGPTIIYISSNCMGRGGDELGEVLMRNFIFTLVETSDLPHTILFVNSGVKLTCAGSNVLEPLQHLADKGVTICSCGLCLEFFKLQDQLQIGQVSNMLETVEAMQQAGRIIQP